MRNQFQLIIFVLTGYLIGNGPSVGVTCYKFVRYLFWGKIGLLGGHIFSFCRRSLARVVSSCDR